MCDSLLTPLIDVIIVEGFIWVDLDELLKEERNTNNTRFKRNART